MKTLIMYRSKHHGNTKKLVDAIVAAHPDDVDAVDVATLERAAAIDVSDYPLVGVASGIYHGNIDKDLAATLQKSLEEGTFVFSLLTYGGSSKWYGRDIDGICRVQRATYLAGYGCLGFDTWGPFKLTGGMQKGHPTQEEICDAVAWYDRLVEEYGEPIQKEFDVRKRRAAWDAEHPDPTLMEKLKNTARHLTGRAHNADNQGE